MTRLLTFLAAAFFSLCAVVFTPFTSETRAANATENVMLVFDASGSMWGQIDGVNKITIARDAINKLVDDLPTSIHMGVMVYGHREKGSCGDIETVLPVGAVDKAKFKNAVAKINPKGMTPISASVRSAAEALKFSEQKATVILVSDGLETCEADPCALAAELEKAGVDFTTHVVGFDLAGQDTKSLQCLAKTTGGKYFEASNAGELGQALTKTVAAVAVAPPAPPKKTDARNLNLTAVTHEGGEKLKKDLFYWVYSPEKDMQGNRKQIAVNGNADAWFELPPGKYHVVARYGNVVFASADLEVKADEATRHQFVMGAGALQLTAIATQGAEPFTNDMFYWIYKPEMNMQGKREQVAMSGQAIAQLQVPAGRYYVSARYGSVVFANADVEVKAGEMTSYQFNMNAGNLRLNAIPAEGQAPLTNDLFYWVFGSEKDMEGNRKQIDMSGQPNPTFRLTAGDYVVRVRHGDKAFAEMNVSVKPGSLSEYTMITKSGVIAAKAVHKGQVVNDGLFWKLNSAEKDMQGNQKQIALSSQPQPVIIVPAGNFVLGARLDGTYHWSKPVTVKAGERQEVSVDIP